MSKTTSPRKIRRTTRTSRAAAADRPASSSTHWARQVRAIEREADRLAKAFVSLVRAAINR